MELVFFFLPGNRVVNPLCNNMEEVMFPVFSIDLSVKECIFLVQLFLYFPVMEELLVLSVPDINGTHILSYSEKRRVKNITC